MGRHKSDFYRRALGKAFVDYEHEIILQIGDAAWTRAELATQLGCCHLAAARRLSKHLEQQGIDSINKLHATHPDELIALEGVGAIQIFVVMCVLDARKFDAEKWYGLDADTVTVGTLRLRQKKAHETKPQAKRRRTRPTMPKTAMAAHA